MEPSLSPVTIYTIREFNEDDRLIREHIFVGNLLDKVTIKALNSGRKDPSQKELRDFFTQYKIKYQREKTIQKFYPYLLELNDSWNDIYYKVREAIKLDIFYLWSPDLKRLLTHQFFYKNNLLDINPSPFIKQTNLDRAFTTYGSLKFNDQRNYLVRNLLNANQQILHLTSFTILETLAKKHTIEGVDLNIFLYRYLPPTFRIDNLYYSIENSGCINDLLRDQRLPINSSPVQIEQIQLEQCTIHINANEGLDPFVNLETIFQLIPMDDTLIFTKVKRGDRSISKISKAVQKFKGQITKDDLAEWSNIEEHHRGLIYRKLKSSPGLVIYKIHDNGFTELQINWTKPTKKQLEEIIHEIKSLNEFLTRVNKLNYHLPERENIYFALADENFINNPLSKTYFTYFNFKTKFDTDKQQISWNAFNYLLKTFDFYFEPIFNWRIFNQKDLRREIGGIAESNFHYLRTNDNLNPNVLNSVLYSLGLVGTISKDQTVTVDRQKDIIIMQQDQLSLNREIDRTDLDESIRFLKEGNPGVLINLKLDENLYVLDVKGAHNLNEINEINYLCHKILQYYFHIASVYKFIKTYNCQNLRLILNSEEKIEAKKDSGIKKIEQKKNDIKDIFDVDDEVEDDMIFLEPANATTDDSNEEMQITKDLVEVPEDEEVSIGSSKKVKPALEYLKDISDVFKTEYRRLGCTSFFPAVISINDFWRNYNRLIKRFETYKNKLKPKDMEEYLAKFQQDFNDPSLEKFKKRVDYVTKKMISSEDKKILTEIADVADRYHKGASMKVPLDKKKTQYSKEHFYFCPMRWCYFCRQSILADEVEVDSKSTNCKKCGNKLYSLSNNKNSYIGFPSSKKNVHTNCLPCCFKSKSKLENKLAECQISHPIKTMPKMKEKVKQGIGHILTGSIYPLGRFGYLDGDMTGPLNNFFNEGIVIDKIKTNQNVFLWKGVNDVNENDAFLEAISYFKHPESNRLTPLELRQHLAATVNLRNFNEIHNGLISTIFQNANNDTNASLDEFRLYLENPDEYLNEELLWHLVSLPDVLIKGGLNLLIIHRTQSPGEKEPKYTMLCPVGIRMEDYFDFNKFVGVLLKLDNGKYYPLSKVTCMVDLQNIMDCTRDVSHHELFSATGEHVIADLYYYANQSCKIPDNEYEKDTFDLFKTLDELDQTPYLDRKLLELIVNPYYQVSYILLNVNLNGKKRLIKFPIKPSPMPIYEVSPIYNEFDDVEAYQMFETKREENPTLSELLDFLKVITKKTRIPIQIRYYIKNNKNEVYGFKMENNLIFYFQTIPEKDFKKEDHPIILNEDPNNIDLAIQKINQDQLDERKDYVNRTTFQKESYQRLRFEISRYFARNVEIQDKIKRILDNKLSIDSKRSGIEHIVAEILDKIAVLKKPNLEGYKLPQIRTLCETSVSCDDPHCTKDKNDKCKVLLPNVLILPNDTDQENSMTRYVVLLSDEILRNVIKRNELLTGKVSIYVNPSQMVYHVDKEILINDPDYLNSINDLYSRTTDYADLLHHNYYLETSEVFMREVEQNLHYFSDESWYKNTGLSRNDFVINTRNIYDLLSDVLAEDIGEQLWNFIDKNDWKRWLNAFREIKNDEYQNIYQYSQFMEHIKYGRSTLTDIHLSLISRLHNMKIIVMNRTAIGTNKFHCLGTTQAQSTTKVYLIFYRYDDEDDIYLVGKTPHLDLTDEKDVMYIFKEDRIPQKFFKLWYDQCKDDHSLQKKPDPADQLISNIPISTDYDTFVDDLESIPDITKEQIIEPPAKPTLPFVIEPEISDKKSPSPIKLKKRTTKEFTFKSRTKPTEVEVKSESNQPSRPSSRPTSRAKSVSRGRSKNVSRTKKITRAKSVSRGRTRTKSVSKGKARAKSVSRGKTRAKSVSRTKTLTKEELLKLLRAKSSSRQKAKQLTFKRRK